MKGFNVAVAWLQLWWSAVFVSIVARKKFGNSVYGIR